MCVVPQEGEEPRCTPAPHYSWTDQEATLLQTASFCSVRKSEKIKHTHTKKTKSSCGNYFSDGPVKQSLRTCCLRTAAVTARQHESPQPRPVASFTFYFSSSVWLQRGGGGATRREEHLLSPPLPPPCQFTTAVSLLSAPSLRNNLLLLFCFVVQNPAVVQTRHCFLMLKLLLVLCSCCCCCALSFLPSRLSQCRD